MTDPAVYNLPHDEWRPYQEESVKWALNSKSKVNILQAPTGSGKSTIGAALGSQGRRCMVVTTQLALQRQYEEYDMVPLFGMGNYPCDYNPILHADMCSFPIMSDCPVFSACKYIRQRSLFKSSTRGSINYSYYLGADWVKDNQRDWNIFDEAHEIRRALMDHLTLQFTRGDCIKMDIPFWKGTTISSPGIRLAIASDWIHMARVNLQDEIEKLSRIAKNNPSVVQKMRRLDQWLDKFTNVFLGIENDPKEWYAHVDEDYIKVAPLSVRNYFHPFFVENYYGKILLMSATIGNEESFADTLGINNYAFRSVPSQFPPDSQPVYDLKAPRMSYGSSPLVYDKQADILTRAITTVPHDWSGILHVNSKAKAKGLARRLSSRGLEDRIYIIEGKGTDEKLSNWYKRKEMTRNSLGISYSFEQGVDLGGEKINISCDVPFTSLADPVERARAEADSLGYKYEAALRLEQRNGRTRRGRKEDYDGDLKLNGLNAICDSNYRIVQRHFSEGFKACLRTW